MRQKSSFHRRLLPVVLLVLAMPVTASAHSVITGAGTFINGALHPFTVTAHLLVLCALGLLAGQRPPLNLKLPLTVFVPLLAIALALTTTGLVKTVAPSILISIALTAGVIVALGRPLPTIVSRLIFALAAISLGLDSPAETLTVPDVIKTLMGTWIALILAVTDIAFYVSHFSRQPWQKIGIRVVGSWITAASLMILAFTLRH